MQMKILSLLCLVVAVLISGTAFAQFNRNQRLYEMTQDGYMYLSHTYFYYHGDHTYELDSLITTAFNFNNQTTYTKDRRIYHYSNERLEQMEYWSTSFVNMETWYEHYDYSYNTQEQLASVFMNYRFPDNPVLNPGFRNHYFYGTIGGQTCLQQIINKTDEPPNPYARTTNYYQSSGDGYRLHYNETWAAWDSTNWEPESRNVYYYIPADTSNTETILDYQLQSALWQYEVPGLNLLPNGLPDHINRYAAWGWPNPETWYWNLVGSTAYTYNDSNQLIQVQITPESYYTFSWGVNGYPTTCHFFGPSGYTEQYSYVWGPDTSSEDPILPLPSALSLNAFPNPFSEHINITINVKKTQPVEGSIYNLKGERVLSFTFSGDDRFAWNSRDQKGHQLPSGIYLVKVNTAVQSATCRVVLLK